MQDDALERLDYGDPAQIGASNATRVRIKRHLNEAYRRLTRSPGCTLLRKRVSVTISAIAGTKSYTVTSPSISFLYDKTNDLVLEKVSLAEIRRMDPGDDVTGTSRYFAIQTVNNTSNVVILWPIPSANVTLYVDDISPITELSGDSDLPTYVHEDFHGLLVTLAMALDYEKKKDRGARRDAMNEYEDGKKELKLVLRKLSGPLIPASNTVQRMSRLGSNFEAGT